MSSLVKCQVNYKFTHKMPSILKKTFSDTEHSVDINYAPNARYPG